MDGGPATTLLDRAGVQEGATQFVGHSVDDWAAGFPTSVLDDGRTALLVVGMNGEPLPVAHGFPARLVVAGLYGYVSAVKWIDEIRSTTWDDFDGYWITKGWSKEGPMKTMSRIDVPRSRETVDAGPTAVAYVAGRRRGHPAGRALDRRRPVDRLRAGFRRKRRDLGAGRTGLGGHTGPPHLQVRAVDGDGAFQPLGPKAVGPDGAEDGTASRSRSARPERHPPSLPRRPLRSEATCLVTVVCTSSTRRSCSATRPRCVDSRNTTWCSRSSCSPNWRRSATIPSSDGRPAPLRALEDLRGKRSAARAAPRQRPRRDGPGGAQPRVDRYGHPRDSARSRTTCGSSVAVNLRDEGAAVVLVSKDLPLRLKAGVVGLDATEFRVTEVSDDGWTGVTDLMVDAESIDALYADGVVDLAASRDLPVNTGVALVAGSQSGLGRIGADKRIHRIVERPVFDVRARSREQHIALDLLTDDRVGIVSLGGRAGTGKSVLALAAALDSVLEQRAHSKVLVFRPLYAVGGQDLGYLPGSESEKMSPWSAAVTDALEAIAGPEVVDEVLHRELLEVLPLTHIRGRSITDSFVIVDEAQNLERNVLLTALTRVGNNTKVVLTHDVAQRDNLRVGRYDGIGAVVDHLKGHPLFGHVTLTRSERSEVAALVAGLLDGRE
ncbi:MAG: PhoH family protein [Acidimicrobiales bacterium]